MESTVWPWRSMMLQGNRLQPRRLQILLILTLGTEMDTSNESFQCEFITRELCPIMWLITHIFLQVWQRILIIFKYLHRTHYLPLSHCPLIYKPTEIFLRGRCTLLLIFFCIGNGRFDAKLCSCFFGCLASLSVCHGMMFSLIEYLIAYSLVWILSRMLWKSKENRQTIFICPMFADMLKEC